MKNWKEVPQYFRGFKIHRKGYKNEKYLFESLIQDNDTNELFIGEVKDIPYSGYGINGVELKEAVLIARPISDMSDEEKLKFHQIVKSYKVSSWDKAINDHEREETQNSGFLYSIDWEIDLLDKMRYDRDGMFYLLSIGVYPFDNNNPKDVIWRYENENKKG